VDRLFQDGRAGSASELAMLPAEINLDLVPTIVNWLRDHLEIAA
jgi:hypothetical protein